ncbi:DsbA family protein [Leucobacter triazinivorans]|uniref:Thioredoxin n=1 Tax=Leucobacter triazinivorans TaxID=1784719 RepID=A0A4P6KGZ7_9MICO|nr:thioredoxin domain-containing protein [Leucobacter triazinivorans]QBE49278.1 thioredoxin [Leucobacter triazinivorans]
MPRTPVQRLRSWSVPVGIIVIAGLLIAILVTQGERGSTGAAETDPATTQQAPPDLTFVETRDPDDVQSAGPADAPVALVIYSDYQCPYCAKWSNETLPAMMDYAELGDLRIEWRDVNQYGADSERGARAAHAAGIQGRFWEFHDALFPNGAHLGPDRLTEEALVSIAGDLGLDTGRFLADMNSDETLAAVQRYAAEGRRLGVSGTPTFVLGGEPIVGAQPRSVFTETLTRKLAEARD